MFNPILIKEENKYLLVALKNNIINLASAYKHAEAQLNTEK